MIFAALKMLTTNISKCIQTLDQMIIYKAAKHQPRIIQTPTLNDRKITTDILDGIPTSFKQHPTACSKSSTHHRTTSHISSKSQPRTTQTSPPNIINPSHTFQPFAKVKSTTPQSTMSTNPQSKSNEPSKSNDMSKTTRVTNKPSCETEVKQLQSCQNTKTTKTQATNKHSCATEVEQFEAPQ